MLDWEWQSSVPQDSNPHRALGLLGNLRLVTFSQSNLHHRVVVKIKGLDPSSFLVNLISFSILLYPLLHIPLLLAGPRILSIKILIIKAEPLFPVSPVDPNNNLIRKTALNQSNQISS